MPRRSLDYDTYFARGKQAQMTLIGSVPQRASMPTHWRCDVCGRELYKSLNACVHHSPCVCRSEMTLKKEDYESLASRLGITWAGVYPYTNKVKVEWFGRGGESFFASYSELAYEFIPLRIRRFIDG